MFKKIKCFFLGHSFILGEFVNDSGMLSCKKKCIRCKSHFGLPDITKKWIDLHAPLPPELDKVGKELKEAVAAFNSVSLFPETMKLIAKNQIEDELKYPNFQEILKSKRDFYGDTEAAIEFACEEYSDKLQKYCVRELFKISFVVINGVPTSAIMLNDTLNMFKQ